MQAVADRDGLFWRLYARSDIPAELKQLTETWSRLLHDGGDGAASYQSVPWRPKDYELWLYARREESGDHADNDLTAVARVGIVGLDCIVDDVVRVKAVAIGGLMAYPQGRGYGSALMDVLERHMPEAVAAPIGFLGCKEETVAFYERLGWVPCPHAVQYYSAGPGDTARHELPWRDIIMAKQLRPDDPQAARSVEMLVTARTVDVQGPAI